MNNLATSAKTVPGVTFAERMNALGRMHNAPPSQLAYALHAQDRATFAEYLDVLNNGFEFTGPDMNPTLDIDRFLSDNGVLTFWSAAGPHLMRADWFADRSEHVTLETYTSGESHFYAERRTPVGNYSDCAEFTGL